MLSLGILSCTDIPVTHIKHQSCNNIFSSRIPITNKTNKEVRCFQSTQQMGKTYYYPVIDDYVVTTTSTKKRVSFVNITNLTFEVVSERIFKVTGHSQNSAESWFVEETRDWSRTYRGYTYLPNPKFGLADAISRFCRLKDEEPHFEIEGAFYSRQGVVVYGVDNRNPNFYSIYFACPDPRNISVQYIDQVPKAVSVTVEGANRIVAIERNDHSEWLLNSEPVVEIDLKSAAVKNELDKMKAAQVEMIEKGNKESGLIVTNKTQHLVRVSFNPNLLKENRKWYTLRVNNRRVLHQNNVIASALRREFYLKDSSCVEFDQLPRNILRIRHTSADRTVNEYFIDTTQLVNGVAYRFFDFNPVVDCPRKVTERHMLSTREKFFAQDFEWGAHNDYGTFLVVNDSILKSRRFFYANIAENEVEEREDLIVEQEVGYVATVPNGTVQVDLNWMNPQISNFPAKKLWPQHFIVTTSVAELESGSRGISRTIPLDLWQIVLQYLR